MSRRNGARPGRIPQIPRSALMSMRAGMDRIPPGLISIPAQAEMWTESAQAILGNMRRPESALVTPGPSSIAEKRNLAVQTLLHRREYQWLFFIDSDMVPHPDTLLRLLATARTSYPACAS